MVAGAGFALSWPAKAREPAAFPASSRNFRNGRDPAFHPKTYHGKGGTGYVGEGRYRYPLKHIDLQDASKKRARFVPPKTNTCNFIKPIGKGSRLLHLNPEPKKLRPCRADSSSVSYDVPTKYQSISWPTFFTLHHRSHLLSCFRFLTSELIL